MNLQGSIFTASNTHISRNESLLAKRLYQYSICLTVGVLSGATGVALTTGLAIAIHSLAFTMIFVPSVTPLMVAATLVGLGVSWLLSQVIDRIVPDMFPSMGKLGMQVVLGISVFTSLLLPLIFAYQI